MPSHATENFLLALNFESHSRRYFLCLSLEILYGTDLPWLVAYHERLSPYFVRLNKYLISSIAIYVLAFICHGSFSRGSQSDQSWTSCDDLE